MNFKEFNSYYYGTILPLGAIGIGYKDKYAHKVFKIAFLNKNSLKDIKTAKEWVGFLHDIHSFCKGLDFLPKKKFRYADLQRELTEIKD